MTGPDEQRRPGTLGGATQQSRSASMEGSPKDTAPAAPAPAAPRHIRTPHQLPPGRLYRVSWRYPSWADGYWRPRYVSHRTVHELVGRLAARGAEWRVEQADTLTVDIGWAPLDVTPLAGQANL